MHRLPLSQQGDLKESADVTVGDVRAAGGTGQPGEQDQAFLVVGETPQLALPERQRRRKLIAGLEGAQGGMKILASQPWVICRLPGEYVEFS